MKVPPGKIEMTERVVISSALNAFQLISLTGNIIHHISPPRLAPHIISKGNIKPFSLSLTNRMKQPFRSWSPGRQVSIVRRITLFITNTPDSSRQYSQYPPRERPTCNNSQPSTLHSTHRNFTKYFQSIPPHRDI